MSIQKHKKVGDIFESKDYTRFKMIGQNREVSEARVKKLAANMKKNGWLSSSIITVNGKNELIDGQHRYRGAAIANVPFKFQIDKNATVREMREINKNQKPWSKGDYIHGFVSDGKLDYDVLAEFAKEHPNYSLTEQMMFLVNRYQSITKQTFESGEFKIGSVQTAKKWVNQMDSIKPFFPDGYNKTNFVRAMIKIFERREEFDFDEFMHKVRLRPGMLFLCGSIAQYVEMVEKLYNYKRQNKISLRFLED